MLNRSIALTILTTFVLISCMKSKPDFTGELFSDVGTLKLTTVLDFERKNKTKDVTATHLIEIGTGLYPNTNQYKLATPKTFQRKEEPGFQMEVEYFYTIADKSVKAILYQWDDLKVEREVVTENNNSNIATFNRFQTKFKQLSDTLTKLMGTPIQKNVKQGKLSSVETFRDSIKWQSANGLNAYLLMFGNNKSGYRQILLVVYRD